MRIIVLLLFSFVIAVYNIVECAAIQCTGIWANSAISPYKEDGFSTIEIISPNGFFSISGSMEGLSLVNKGKSIHLDLLFSPPLVEVLWAPDSLKFVINMSDGGLVGTWETHIYLIDGQGNPVHVNIQNFLLSISDKIPQCEPKESVNVGIAAWLNESKEILLIVEVPPHSTCRNMGAITGFRISTQEMKVVEIISENELRKNWSHTLGCRFSENSEKAGAKP